MNAKERVQITLNHQEPDRVPMMMSANTWVVERIKAHLGVQTDFELLKAMHIDIFDMRGIDYKGAAGPRFVGPDTLNIPQDWCGDLFPVFGYYEVVTETPHGKAYSAGEPCLSGYNTLQSLATYPWPQADWFDFSPLRQALSPWVEDFAIAATGASVFQHPTLFRGFEQLLLDMALEPEITSFILEEVSGFYYDYFKRMFEEAGDLIDIFRIADDLGAQDHLLISPQMIHLYLAEHIKKLTYLAHEYDIKVLFHTDGNVRQIIPDLIAWGIDILDPLQPEVPAMNAAEMKQLFGDQLSFSGGISAQDVLPNGTTDGVRQEVKRVLDQLAPGGGYILSPGHPSLQGDIPVENIVAMYAAGVEFGTY